MDNTHRIVQVKGHYEVHDRDECYNDLVDMLVAEARAESRMENIRERVPAWVNMNTDIKDHINTRVNLY